MAEFSSLHQKEICFKTSFSLAVFSKMPKVELVEQGLATWAQPWGMRDLFQGTECVMSKSCEFDPSQHSLFFLSVFPFFLFLLLLWWWWWFSSFFIFVFCKECDQMVNWYEMLLLRCWDWCEMLHHFTTSRSLFLQGSLLTGQKRMFRDFFCYLFSFFDFNKAVFRTDVPKRVREVGQKPFFRVGF